MIIDLIIILTGLIISPLLFFRFPMLRDSNEPKVKRKVSVIIPARNEGHNLPLILGDLKNQTEYIFEIICVDDGSTDDTAERAVQFGARLISPSEKPDGWTGKSWACQNGADASGGDLLLFLDADVRISPDGIRRMMREYENCGCAISVLPYHQVEKAYEQFSMVFNMIQVAANGISLPFDFRSIGLYGPCILLGREEYFSVGGHSGVRGSIVDDLALGKKLTESNIPYKLLLGGSSISFRMYGDSLKSLLMGWAKNFATGAAKTNLLILIMVFLWVSSSLSVPLHLIKSAIAFDLASLALMVFLYLVWVAQMHRISRRIGSFSRASVLLYPLMTLVFICVFAVSFFKKLFRMKVVWKDREIELRD